MAKELLQDRGETYGTGNKYMLLSMGWTSGFTVGIQFMFPPKITIDDFNFVMPTLLIFHLGIIHVTIEY